MYTICARKKMKVRDQGMTRASSTALKLQDVHAPEQDEHSFITAMKVAKQKGVQKLKVYSVCICMAVYVT